LASTTAALLGWSVLALLERLTPLGQRIWLVLAVLVLAASLPFGPLSGTGVTATDRLVLVLMHLAVAAILITGFSRSSTA
jgi:Family of unknown function (DUF6069)